MRKKRSQIGVGLFDQPSQFGSSICPCFQEDQYNIFGWDSEDRLVADIFVIGEWRSFRFRMISCGNGDECWEADIQNKAVFFHCVNKKVAVEVDE